MSVPSSRRTQEQPPESSTSKAPESIGHAAGRFRRNLRALCATVAAVGAASTLNAQNANYYQFGYNAQRNGWNSNETALNPSIVHSGAFGELFNSPQFASYTSGNSTFPAHMYATPLYVDSVTLTAGSALLNAAYAGATVSVIYACTTNDDVYAVCAAGVVYNGTPIPAGTILWRTTLGSPETIGLDGGIPMGVLATPTIDPTPGPGIPPTLYLTADTSNLGWLAFALDITNGSVRNGWPVPINNNTISPVLQNGPATYGQSKNECQRGAPAVSADHSQLYVPIGDYNDTANGYLIAITTTGTPAITSAFAQTKNGALGGPQAGIWAPGGVSLDGAGNIYGNTGNDPVPISGGNNVPTDVALSTPNADNQPGAWGMSMLVFSPTSSASKTLALKGTYTPWNYQAMDQYDIDIASGPNILPDLPGLKQHLVAFGSKAGNIFLVDRDNLPGGLVQRPLGPNGFTVDMEKSFINPNINYSYYGNKPGPLNVFGPYTENQNNVGLAKSRTTPAYYRTADGNSYLVFTGATKTLSGQSVQQQAKPPCIARLKINTFSSATPYLTVDAYEQTQIYKSPGSPIVTSNGGIGFVSWNLDANAYRGDAITNSQPYIVAVDPTTTPIQTLFQTPVGTLHPGGKYNSPSAAHGMVFVGTDRVQVFGLTLNAAAIAAGSSSNAGMFAADADFNGGVAVTTTNTINLNKVTHPAPAALYQSCRAGVAGQNGFTYTIPNLVPGNPYVVRLHFCDTAATAAKQRLFNVAINSTQVLNNYDIYATAGANTAVTEPFGAIAQNDGSIAIAFTVGSANQPIVSGIEVSSIPSGAPVLSAPVAGSDNNSPLTATYFLPAAGQSGGVTLDFFNGTNHYGLTLADSVITAGSHTISFHTADQTQDSSIASGVTIPDGNYTITLSFLDTTADPVQTSQVSNVTIDTSAPTIAAPNGGFTPLTVLLPPTGSGPLADYTGQAVVNDNSGVAPTVTQSPAAGTIESVLPDTPPLVVPVTLTATDGAGNTASITFNVTFYNNNVLLSAPTSNSVSRSPLTVTYTLPAQAAAGGVTVHFVDASNNVTDLIVSDANGAAGPHTITIPPQNPTSSSDIASGGPVADGVYSITVLFLDTNSDPLVTSATATNVTIDTTPPTISAPSAGFNPLAVTANALTNQANVPDYRTEVQKSDNFAGVTVLQSPTPGTSKPIGQVTITLSAVDAAGNPSVNSISFPLTIKPGNVTATTTAQAGVAPRGAGGPLVPGDAILSAFGVPSINDVGELAYAATWKATSGKKAIVGSGIFVGNPAVPVVTVQSPVPGPDLTGYTWKSFNDPVLDADGNIAFIATIADAKGKISKVVATNAFTGDLSIVARTGSAAPVTNGPANFSAFYSVSLQAQQVTVVATLAPGGPGKVKPANNMGVFQYTPTGSSQVVRKGDPLTINGTPQNNAGLHLFNTVVGSPGQGREEDSDGANVAYVATFPKGVQAVMEGLNAVAVSGTSGALTLPDNSGAEWAGFGPYATNAKGAGAMLAKLVVGAGGITKTNAQGIFLNSSGTFDLVAQLGKTNAGVPRASAVFKSFLDPVLSDDSSGVAFFGTVTGAGVTPATSSGIWWQPTPSTLKLVAQTGVSGPPYGPTNTISGAQWKSFRSIALPGGGRGPIFTGTLATGAKLGGYTAKNDFGLWAFQSDGTIDGLVRTGATISGSFVSSFSFLNGDPSSPGISRGFNNTGGIVTNVTFKDSSGLHPAIVLFSIP